MALGCPISPMLGLPGTPSAAFHITAFYPHGEVMALAVLPPAQPERGKQREQVSKISCH